MLTVGAILNLIMNVIPNSNSNTNCKLLISHSDTESNTHTLTLTLYSELVVMVTQGHRHSL